MMKENATLFSAAYFRAKISGLLIAILGVIQFYVSPGIFGFINLSGPVDPYVLKATSDVFPNWMIYLRATSILSSPQVLVCLWYCMQSHFSL